MRVSFPGGGRMTFGVRAASEQQAREVAGQRIAGLGGAEIEVVPLDTIGFR